MDLASTSRDQLEAEGPPRPILTARHLAGGYSRRHKVFSDLSFTIGSDTRTVLLGPNGAGKSTLLKTLSGVLPLRGSELLDHQERGLTSSSLRRMIASMPQDVAAIPGLTVSEQITYAGWLSGLSTPESRRHTSGVLAATEPDRTRRQTILTHLRRPATQSRVG